jgi:hypothetical protein
VTSLPAAATAAPPATSLKTIPASWPPGWGDVLFVSDKIKANLQKRLHAVYTTPFVCYIRHQHFIGTNDNNWFPLGKYTSDAFEQTAPGNFHKNMFAILSIRGVGDSFQRMIDSFKMWFVEELGLTRSSSTQYVIVYGPDLEKVYDGAASMQREILKIRVRQQAALVSGNSMEELADSDFPHTSGFRQMKGIDMNKLMVVALTAVATADLAKTTLCDIFQRKRRGKSTDDFPVFAIELSD